MARRRRNGDNATTARINPCSHSCILPTLLLVCLPYTPTFRFVLSRGVWFHSVPIRVVLLLTLHSNPVDTNGLWGSSVDRRPPWDRNYTVEPPTRIECVGMAPESSSCSPGIRFLVLTTLLPLQQKGSLGYRIRGARWTQKKIVHDHGTRGEGASYKSGIDTVAPRCASVSRPG